MRSKFRCLTTNQGRLRTHKVNDIEFRTYDRKVDFEEDWRYRNEMLEVCNYMGVKILWFRSDSFRAYAQTISITVNPPTTGERLRIIAHEAAHVGFRHSLLKMPRHRQEFETGTFEDQFLQHCGISLDPKKTALGKKYVANLIRMAIRRRVKRFDRESWLYAQSTQLPDWIEEVMKSIDPILCDRSEQNGYREAMAEFNTFESRDAEENRMLEYPIEPDLNTKSIRSPDCT